MANLNRSTNRVYPRRRYIKIAREISSRNQHRLISVSPRNIFYSDNASVSRIAIFFLRYVDMDARREFDEVIDGREICIICSNLLTY